MLAVRIPGAPQTARVARPLVPPSPLRDRVSYSDHDRFRGYFPVHLIPAYNLPVYASQRPLPDATQDSVRGCSLGFAAAVIADGRLQRACKAQPAQIRTGGFPAYGSHLGYDGETGRLRSSACDTLSRFCARRVLCWPAFPSAPALRSTGSAAECSALFAGFAATTAGSDFSRPWHHRPASAPRLPDADQNGLRPVVGHETSQVPTRSLRA